MEEKIDKILIYSLLAAKSVLTLDDAALLTGLSKPHAVHKRPRRGKDPSLRTDPINECPPLPRLRELHP